jgi:CBS domain-containing protein
MGDNKKSARDVMTPNPDCVRSSDNVREAARIMKSSDTGVVPVVDGKKIIGLITDRDIVVRGLAEGKDLGNCRVNDVMTQPARTVREDTPVGEILDLMSRSEIRRVPVVDRNDELVGIVSIGDISTATNQDNKVGKAIEDISKAAPNN